MMQTTLHANELKAVGLKAYDSKIVLFGGYYYLNWGDYWPKDGLIVRFIEARCISCAHFDNGAIATFCAKMSEEQYQLLTAAYGEDIQTWHKVEEERKT